MPGISAGNCTCDDENCGVCDEDSVMGGDDRDSECGASNNAVVVAMMMLLVVRMVLQCSQYNGGGCEGYGGSCDDVDDDYNCFTVVSVVC